jgi:hypothetical protein
MGRSYNNTDLARFTRPNIVGPVLCVVSEFILAGNCIVVDDISFLKLIKSISLFRFPHIGVFLGIA